MGRTKSNKTQWHPLSYAAIQLTFAEQCGELDYSSEIQLGKLPPRMDMLIIKKREDIKIRKSIGHIFRMHNIVEYKGIGDSLDISAYMKAVSYALYYGSMKGVTPDHLTLTLMRFEKPVKLLKDLERKYGCDVCETSDGVYIVSGNTMFPVQILHIGSLPEKDYAWLHTLSDTAPKKDVLEQIFKESTSYRQKELIDNRSELLQDLNNRFPVEMETFTEDKNMAKTFEELMERVAQRRIDDLTQELSEKDAAILEKDAAISEKDAAISEKDAALSEKDAALSEKDAAISEKDAAISEKDAEIARLRQQIEALTAAG